MRDRILFGPHMCVFSIQKNNFGPMVGNNDGPNIIRGQHLGSIRRLDPRIRSIDSLPESYFHSKSASASGSASFAAKMGCQYRRRASAASMPVRGAPPEGSMTAANETRAQAFFQTSPKPWKSEVPRP